MSKSTKVRYYPSFPFGRLHYQYLCENFNDFDWLSINAEDFADMAFIDSNALQFVKEVKEPRVLLVNPIIKKIAPNEPLPIYLKHAFMTKAFLKRSQRYKLNLFLDAYAYPHDFPTKYKTAAKEILKDFKNWEKLIRLKHDTKDQSALIHNKIHLYLENPADSLRSKEDLSFVKQYKRCELPHGLLALDTAERTYLKNQIQDLGRML